jgi:hypothetical protein
MKERDGLMILNICADFGSVFCLKAGKLFTITIPAQLL